MNRIVLATILVISFGCKSQSTEPQPAPLEKTATIEQEKVMPATPTANTPPAAVVITHRVADYDKWKTAFDEHAAVRAEAGILGFHINRGAEDANMVSIYLPAKDLAGLKGMLASDNLKAAMKNAGVEGAPQITLMTPQEDKSIKDRALAGVIIVHEVEDYDAWKKVYDEAASVREAAGLIGSAVNRAVDNPNLVIVYVQAEDASTLKAFLANPDLKAAMKKGGVKGEPTFNFVNAEANN